VVVVVLALILSLNLDDENNSNAVGTKSRECKSLDRRISIDRGVCANVIDSQIVNNTVILLLTTIPTRWNLAISSSCEL
jgi:hypothetical protein